MTSLFCKNCRNLAVTGGRRTFAPMKEMPGFIEGLVRALARCEDVDESTIVRLSCRLMRSPRTAVLLTCFAELGYCDSEQLLSECNRLLKVTGGR